jgi:ABC-2 type transport system ATP-binding protein
VGYLPENVGFYDELTGRENLRYVTQLNQLPSAKAGPLIEAALATVGLADEGEKLVGQYSRGMRQRLGLAELLVKEPKLVILDEPALGLDPDGMNKMLDLIVSLNRQQGITVLMCSHLLNQVERICARVGIMSKGKLVAYGAIEDLRRAKATEGKETLSLEDIYLRYFQEG